MQRSARPTTNTYAELTPILSQRIDWLYRNLPATAIGHLIGAIVTTGVLWRITPRFTLLAWFACCASVTIPGFVAYRRYRRFGTLVSDPRAWVGVYVATTCLGGISWGAAGFILFPPASLDYQAMLSLFLIGAAVGSVATDAVYFPAVAAFVIPCLIPLAIRLSLEAKEFYYWWAAGALFLMRFLLEAARNLEKLFVGQRSGVRPVFGSLRSQNQLKVRRSRVSRNAVCRAVSADGGVGPEMPVIDVALVHADAIRKRATEDRRKMGWKSVIVSP